MSSSINIQSGQGNGTNDCLRQMLKELKKNARMLRRQTTVKRRIKKDIASCGLTKEDGVVKRK